MTFGWKFGATPPSTHTHTQTSKPGRLAPPTGQHFVAWLPDLKYGALIQDGPMITLAKWQTSMPNTQSHQRVVGRNCSNLFSQMRYRWIPGPLLRNFELPPYWISSKLYEKFQPSQISSAFHLVERIFRPSHTNDTFNFYFICKQYFSTSTLFARESQSNMVAKPQNRKGTNISAMLWVNVTKLNTNSQNVTKLNTNSQNVTKLDTNSQNVTKLDTNRTFVNLPP